MDIGVGELLFLAISKEMLIKSPLLQISVIHKRF